MTALALTLGLLGCAQPPLRPDGPPPNLVVIEVDDVGIDRLSAYAAHPHPAHTPVLDALAARSVRFDHAWAEPTCSPGRAAFLTGQHPSRVGAGEPLKTETEDWELPLDAPTIPKLLHGAGYDTALVGKWHLSSWNSPNAETHPWKAGFDHFEGPLGNLGQSREPTENAGYYHYEEVREDRSVAWVDRYATTEQVDDAIRIQATIRAPWLLWFTPSAPHEPLDAPPPALLSQPLAEDAPSADRYDAMLEALDTELGRLLAALPPDTWVFLTSDNGTSGNGIRPPLRVMNAKHSLGEIGLRVPLLVSGPGLSPRTDSRLVSAVDLLPTLVSMAGLDLAAIAPGVPFDGQNVFPLVARPGSAKRTIYAEQFSPNGMGPWQTRERAAFDGEWKLIVDQDGGQQLHHVDGIRDGKELLQGGAPEGPEADAVARLRPLLDAALPP